jgi:outer membrane protein assembly factor BamB
MDEPGNPMLAYGNGLLLMGSYSSCAVYAIDVSDGTKVWETWLETAMGYMTCYADGKFFVGTQSMHIYALDEDTGEVIWHNDDGVRNRAFNVWCINYAYDRIYLHDLGFVTTGAQKCFDADTGEMLWASPDQHLIGYYTTVVGDGKIYGERSDSSTTTGREEVPDAFACWDAFTGEVIWQMAERASGPILAYGCLYFMMGNQVYAMSTAVPPKDYGMWRNNMDMPSVTLDHGPTDLSEPKWVFTSGAGIISSPVAADGKVYFNSNDRKVYCLDAYTGEEIWNFMTNEPRMATFGSSPAVYAGRVYIGPDDGNFYVLDADDGDLITSVPMGTYRPVEASLGQHNIKSSPAIYDGKVYVGSQHNGRVYCLSLSGTVEWSTEINDGDPILGSVGIADGYIYIMSDDNNIYKLDMDGNVVLNFYVRPQGSSFWSGFWGVNSYTPTIVGEKLWVGGTNDYYRCYNVTDGEQLYAGIQPNVAGETSHGAMVYIPPWILSSAINQTDGSSVSANSADGFLLSQAGPTVALARADDGENIWSAWGGWQVWSTPLFTGFDYSARVYFGSDSYSITCLDARTGMPISWYTTRGNVVSSPCLWDGKLYCGSYDNNMYCFEDHVEKQTAISVSVDRTSVNVDAGDSVTVTAQLTGVPWINVYEEIGAPAPVPPLGNTDILVTFTDPNGVENDLTATTDEDGWASVSYTPDTVGTWKVISWYMGEDGPVSSRTYAFSDEIMITASAAPPPGPDPLVATVSPTSSNIMLGESVALTVSTSGGTAGFMYQWYTYVSGTAVQLAGETGATLGVSPDAEGTYGYFCEATDACGQVDSTDTAEVKVAVEPPIVEEEGIPMEYILILVAAIIIVVNAIITYILVKRR